DYNRAGVPLVEIVTKPIFRTEHRAPEVAKAYVSTIRDIVRALGVSEARMERGNLRCDANVSLRPRVQPAVEAGEKVDASVDPHPEVKLGIRTETDRKSTRLNSSHVKIS